MNEHIYTRLERDVLGSHGRPGCSRGVLLFREGKKMSKLREEKLYKAFEKYNTQIQAILFLDPLDSKESYRKIDKALKILYGRMEELVQQKPEVTEAFIEEKELKLFKAIIKSSTLGGGFIRHFSCPTKIGTQLRKDFIRSLYEEMPVKKMTVGEEFIERWYPRLQWLPCSEKSREEFRNNMKQMLKEANVEIKEKK